MGGDCDQAQNAKEFRHAGVLECTACAPQVEGERVVIVLRKFGLPMIKILACRVIIPE